MYFMYMGTLSVYTSIRQKTASDNCNLPFECWELNSRPLATEPSLQPPNFNGVSFFFFFKCQTFLCDALTFMFCFKLTLTTYVYLYIHVHICFFLENFIPIYNVFDYISPQTFPNTS